MENINEDRSGTINLNGAVASSVSERKREANRRNCLKSTGPKSLEGRAVSRMNALKHGLASKEVLVRGSVGRESGRELASWHERFHSHLKPVGPIEELLVDQIVTLRWRLRRVLAAEAGEIALGTDQGQRDRECNGLQKIKNSWDRAENVMMEMGQSAAGNMFLEEHCELVKAVVEVTGEISQEVLSEVVWRGKPYGLTRKLMALRAECPPTGATAEARAAYRTRVLDYLEGQAGMARQKGEECARRERREEEARRRWRRCRVRRRWRRSCGMNRPWNGNWAGRWTGWSGCKRRGSRRAWGRRARRLMFSDLRYAIYDLRPLMSFFGLFFDMLIGSGVWGLGSGMSGGNEAKTKPKCEGAWGF